MNNPRLCCVILNSASDLERLSLLFLLREADRTREICLIYLSNSPVRTFKKCRCFRCDSFCLERWFVCPKPNQANRDDEVCLFLLLTHKVPLPVGDVGGDVHVDHLEIKQPPVVGPRAKLQVTLLHVEREPSDVNVAGTLEYACGGGVENFT